MAEGGGWRDPNLREYTVRVALDTQGATNLKPAMRCEARIILDSVPETVTVPVQAVFNEGAVQFVYRPSGSKFSRVPVRVGKRSDTIAEIAKGLDEGEVVLVREPSPGEVLAESFSPLALTAAGYKLDEQGKVLAEGGGMRGGPGAGRGPAREGEAGRGGPPAAAGGDEAGKGRGKPKRDSKPEGAVADKAGEGGAKGTGSPGAGPTPAAADATPTAGGVKPAAAGSAPEAPEAVKPGVSAGPESGGTPRR
jgi:hypothetical protein